jgi:regulator of sigma E protease
VLITLVSFLVVIGVLVFVHELGHLIAAKSVGIACPRFSIGFGPRIAGFRWGETEYVVSLLPLGGYVRMAGMEDTAALEGGAEPEREPSPRDFDAQSIPARILVVTAGVIMNFLFAIVTVAAVALALGEPVNPTTRVAVMTPEATGAAAPLAAIPQGAELTAVGDERVTDWLAVSDALADAPAGPVTLHFSDAGPVTLQMPAGDSARAALLRPIQPFTHAVIGEVIPGSPAASDGLLAGDSIVSAGGAPIRSWSEFVEVVRSHPGQALELVVQRDGHLHPLSVTPDAETEKDAEGRELRVGKLGVAPQLTIEHRPLGPGASLRRGWDFTWNTSAEIVHLLGSLFTGEASPRNLGGALTIGQISGQAARAGFEVFLQWMALLSVNLAVLNLLPIPVLDGGQLLFLIVEGLRGRPLSVEQRLRLSHVGLIIVVGLMVWAITNDVLRLFGI